MLVKPERKDFMSYSIPYTFVPGTKARAQEVNANFSSIIDAFDDLDNKKINLDLSNISEQGIDVIKNSTVARNIGEIFYAPFQLTDAGVHLLDGALLNYEGIYKNFIKYIQRLYNENPNANYFCTESQWQSSVSTYGVCGKFVYDSTANTVRLPKITGIIEGTTSASALGTLVEAGLPNIRGKLSVYAGGNSQTSGALKWTKVNGTNNPGSGDMLGTRTFEFDASQSSSLYKNSFSKVQPQTIKCFVYIVIASSTKTDIQVDIDNIATDLNGKADTDLTNVTDTAKVLMSGMGMPSNKYVDLTLGASGASYTAPADGYVVFRRTSTAAGQTLQITNVYSGLQNFIHNGNTSSLLGCYLPVKKGDRYAIGYTLGSSANQVFRFIYAVGSESEAN